MSYRIVFTKNAARDIKKLDKVTQKRLSTKLTAYSISPEAYFRKLTDNKIGSYRWRIGKYRVVFDIVNKNIVILRVRHRKEVYRT